MSLTTSSDRNGLPPVLQTVFADTDYAAFSVTGPERDAVVVDIASGEGAGALADACCGSAQGRGADILRVRTLRKCASFPKVQAPLRIDAALPRGTVFMAYFSMRAAYSELESGEVSTQFEIENADNFAISTQFAAYAASQWQEFCVPFRLVCDTLPGVAAISFRVGAMAQELELRDIRVELFGPQTALADLPATPVRPRYEGMEAGAVWREQAQERIRLNRMAPLQITIAPELCATGNIEVQISQKRHAYWFGSAVQARLLAGAERSEGYAREVKRLFNALVFENDMKWRQWLEDRSRGIEGARWCAQNGIALRGHTLVWPSFAKAPDALCDELSADPRKLQKALEERIDDIATATADWTEAWDVVNEPFRHNDFLRILGDCVMADWFRRAHRAAPASRLFLNDYGIVTGGGMDEQHQRHYEQTARDLLAAGAPLHGLGLQGHVGRILTPPQRMLAILDRFAALGLEIQMTEFSTHLEDAQLAADYLRDVLTVFYSHPATSAFMLWGFSDQEDFKHGNLLLNADGSLTPSGSVWMEMVFGQWWTNERLAADAEGQVCARVFHGLHEVTLLRDGEVLLSRCIDVGTDGAQMTLGVETESHAACAGGSG